MNDSKPIQETEFVFRRLTEALHLAGREVDGRFWLAILIPVLLAAGVYVVWMYARDSRSVGAGWATLLGALRGLAYALLAFVFLLPAWQTWETTRTASKVVVVLDVSGSTATKDDLPTDAVPVDRILSRQDKVIRFLTDSQVKFLSRLQERNPVTAYRFGGVLDEDARAFADGRSWSAADWAAWLKLDLPQSLPEDLTEDERNARRRQVDLQALLVNGTNLGESLLGVINREHNNMLQGVVVFSDGRSTQYSDQTFQEIQGRADRDKIPIFTVGIGEHREPVNLRIANVLVPERVRPDDRFPIRVEVEGEGLADREVPVTLRLWRPKTDPKKDKPSFETTQTGRFGREGVPPRLQVEFPIEAAGLPPELRKADNPAKPEMEEGEWKVVAAIPRDKREVFLAREHVSEPATVNVVKKPLRVLLFGDAATRDLQFARTLFVRETDRGRAILSVCLQRARPGAVQDVPPERLLTRFPGSLRAPGEKGEDRYDNLAEYDLIVAFDPDWTQLLPEHMANLERWVEAGGGLVVIGGPVYTFQLTRSANYEKVRPLLDLYPVILDDSRVQGAGGIDRPTTEPWRLNFPGATAEMEFLKLDEDRAEPLAGWEEFFTGHPRGEDKNAPVVRGFYNYYPVKDKKPSAVVVATFADPRARLADSREQPYLVVAPFKRGRVVYLGSGEAWRLRQYREAYHERFWTKLARYASAGSLGGQRNPSELLTGQTGQANRYFAVDAKLLGPDLQPLPQSQRPRVKIQGPQGVHVPDLELQARGSQAGDWGGYFTGRFLPTAAGNYEMRLPVPGTLDVLTRKVIVRESNPESDNLQPDFGQLRRVASDASDVLARIGEAIGARVRAELERTNRLTASEKSGPGDDDRDKPRLFFDLKSATLIPECMVTASKTQKSRGRVRDWWDQGFLIRDDPRMKISYALLAVVGLLSLEWLIRKLLRLA